MRALLFRPRAALKLAIRKVFVFATVCLLGLFVAGASASPGPKKLFAAPSRENPATGPSATSTTAGTAAQLRLAALDCKGSRSAKGPPGDTPYEFHSEFDSKGRRVSWVDLQTGKTTRITLPKPSYFEGTTPAGKEIYFDGRGTLYLVNALSGVLVRHAADVYPDITSANGACGFAQANGTEVEDLATGKIVATDIDAGRCQSVTAQFGNSGLYALTPDGAHLYIANGPCTSGSTESATKSSVAVLTPPNALAATVTIPTGDFPSIALTPDGRYLYIADDDDSGIGTEGEHGVVSVLDTTDDRLVANMSLPRGDSGDQSVAMSQDGRFAYTGGPGDCTRVTCSNVVNVISTATMRLVKVINIDNPDFILGALFAAPGGNSVFVLGSGGDEPLYRLNSLSNRVSLVRKGFRGELGFL
jgi:DNA-binding beta-propeller fold protein YncE